MEKNDLIYHLSFINGAGFAFLIPGFIENSNLFIITGLIFLIVGNILYYHFYLPRQQFLIIKRKIEISTKKK
ncbi:hypothetical protein CMI40_00550 [Candidatus Pacearchaeota archaeon]|nr:hypothetical protein [Candidatus Pacearchaeota archaeon]